MRTKAWKRGKKKACLGTLSDWLEAKRHSRSIRSNKRSGQARKKPGAPRRLSTDERQRIPELLARGAESYGFQGEVWTCRRVSKVIQREFGISYHPAHVSRILKDLGWTPQKPIRRAKQRAEEEVRRWQDERWPELKKRPKGKDKPSFS